MLPIESIIIHVLNTNKNGNSRRPSTGGVGGGVPVEGLVGGQSSEGVGDGGSSLW